MILHQVVHALAPKLIHRAENSPVVAAYGTVHELANTTIIPNLEWDVFLDPHLVHECKLYLTSKKMFCSCVCQMMNIENSLVNNCEIRSLRL